MQATLNRIKKVNRKTVNERRVEAAYSGAMNDGGAGMLEEQLSWFLSGIQSAIDVLIDVDSEYSYLVDEDTEYSIPQQWRKYFIEEDLEYQKYLELKKKFENR